MAKHDIQQCICVVCEDLRKDAARYRHLRDHTGNKLMRKLMTVCEPNLWDKSVDAEMTGRTSKAEL